MRSIFFLQFLLVCIHSLALPTEFAYLSQYNGTSLNLPLVDAQHLGIDPRFMVRYQYLEEDVNSRSVFMNTLYFITKEAREDFRGNLSGVISVSEPTWPQTVIVASSLPGQLLERRFIIWTLHHGINHLAIHGFQSISLHIEWDNQEVGVVVILSSDSQSQNRSLDIGNQSNATKATSIEQTDQPTAVQQGPANVRSTIEPSYLADATTLSRSSSFVPMIAALTWLASFDWYDDVSTFMAKNDEFGTSFTLLNVGSGPEPHGPKATMSDFVIGIWSLAQYMDRSQRFAEIYANLEIVGRLIGKLLLVKWRRGLAVFSNGTSSEALRTS